MFFLIDYVPPRSELVSLRTFPDSEWNAAMDARLEREIELHHLGIQDHEVVVLQAASMETLKVTHGRYFKTLEELFDDLVNAITSR